MLLMFLSIWSIIHPEVTLALIHVRSKRRGQVIPEKQKKLQKWANWINSKSWHLADQSNKSSEPSQIWQVCMHFIFLFHSACRAVKLAKAQNFIWLIPLLATCHWEQHLMCQKCVKKSCIGYWLILVLGTCHWEQHLICQTWSKMC